MLSSIGPSGVQNSPHISVMSCYDGEHGQLVQLSEASRYAFSALPYEACAWNAASAQAWEGSHALPRRQPDSPSASDDLSSTVASTPSTPHSPSSLGSEEAACAPLLDHSADLRLDLASTNVALDHFMLSLARGEVSPIDQVGAPSYDLGFGLQTRVVVRRREMDSAGDFFHSIRTRTASIVSVCFAGSAADVLKMAARIPRMSFSEAHFQRSAEHAVGATNYVLLCTTIRDATEQATFGFAHGASPHPEPALYRVDAVHGLYAVVFEYVLTAIDTTIRNLNGQREVVIDLGVLIPQETELVASWADFKVKVDIQPGESGRNRTTTGTTSRRAEVRQPRVAREAPYTREKVSAPSSLTQVSYASTWGAGVLEVETKPMPTTFVSPMSQLPPSATYTDERNAFYVNQFAAPAYAPYAAPAYAPYAAPTYTPYAAPTYTPFASYAPYAGLQDPRAYQGVPYQALPTTYADPSRPIAQDPYSYSFPQQCDY